MQAFDPRSFIDEVFARNRAIFGASRMDGEGDDGGEGGDGGGEGRAYTPPASQEEFDRIVQARLSRATSKFKDYDEVKAKASQYDALEAELGTTAEKAAAKAAKDAEEKTRGTFAPRLVRAEFKAAAKGAIEADVLKDLLEDVDLSRYVDDDGEVDEDKVARKVKAWAGASVGSSRGGGGGRDLGQGRRRQAAAVPGDAGRAAAEKRFGNKSN